MKGFMKNIFKITALSVLLFNISFSFAYADVLESYGKKFGSMYLNMNFRYALGTFKGRGNLGSEPCGYGIWQFKYDAQQDMFLDIFGIDDSQPYLKVRVGEGLKEALLFSPTGRYTFWLPPSKRVFGDEYNEAKSGNTFVRLSAPTYKELCQYKNLALNPYDFQTTQGLKQTFYPHASASSECRNEIQFAARNAISGRTDNKEHSGWKYRSWGPEQEKESELKIDFGREVEIDKVVVYQRADFPHDDIWQTGSLEFSDGKKIPLNFKKQATPQEFSFPKQKTSYIKITNLTSQSIAWRAFTEVEVWGHEILPFKAYDKNGTKQSFALALASLKVPTSKVLNRWVWRLLEQEYPVQCDWLLQDVGFNLMKLPDDNKKRTDFFVELASSLIKNNSNVANIKKFSAEIKKEHNLNSAINLYLAVRAKLRLDFLAKLNGLPNKFVYVERHPIAPSFYGYTEGASDARGEALFTPNSALCMLSVSSTGEVKREVLLEDKTGAIRDPDVSYDATKILFSWKKHQFKDDFHLYEMDLTTRKIRQITQGKCADIEAKYLPTDEIVFNSTRCEQTTDCWITEVSNLYMMKTDGSFLRRVGFDQVCTTYPTVTEQGNVVYTRWDYSDRGQMFPQGLFLMKPDGSFQTELYGNKSWYPTAIGHARQIPNTNKFLATLHGHHTAQRGKLAVIDPSLGRQEDSGVILLAPVRKEKPMKADLYGQRGEQFQYPYPLSEELFLTTFEPIDADNRSYPSPYGLYLMNPDGRRELLVSHPILDCKQAVAIMQRPLPKLEKSRVDYRSNKGYLFVRNIYYGDGVKGVKKGSIKKLRVVKIDYRKAPVGALNGFNNEGGVDVFTMVCTPVGLGNATWDTKEILGEVDIEKDGSVYFEIPARTPVYFQPIDENGYAVTTMRSWTTMQPNEFYSCLGCHGDRDTPNPIPLKIAKDRKPKKLKPFYNVKGGFSFKKHIQPILNKHCITCHNDRSKARILSLDGTSKLSVADIAKTEGKQWEDLEKKNSQNAVRAFSLLDYPILNKLAKRVFNDAYYNLLSPQLIHGGHVCYADFRNPVINWAGMLSIPTLLPPYYRGAAKSEIMEMLREGHGNTKLTQEELDKLAAWIDLYVPYCGDYYEANAWSKEDKEFYHYYETKNKSNEKVEIEAIKEYLEKQKKD